LRNDDACEVLLYYNKSTAFFKALVLLSLKNYVIIKKVFGDN
jgi:hypothetical protein